MSHTDDLDEAFFPTLRLVAADLGAESIDMLSVMMSESGVRADAHNDGPPGAPDEKRYHASGLIQFMPATLVGLGWTSGHAAFRTLSATAQLEYVRRYYMPHRGYLKSIGGLYVATFLPALTSHAGNPSFVLTARGGPLGWAYAPNAVFDVNNDLAITVGELEQAVARNCKGGRWSEIASRCSGQFMLSPDDDAVDLRTVRGIQIALVRAGLNPGPVDGIPGPKTARAIVEFQSVHGLVADGVVGPITRAELAATLG